MSQPLPREYTSAYMFFAQAQRDALRTANPDATFGQIGVLMASQWKGMNAADRQQYVDLAEADKARYLQELERYEAENPKHSEIDGSVA
uniref:HMG box domain-containing protein n=1 Tax=Mycena chlorophos TaxID=658473 RepID=A0ABQ0M073_MYCCL|nr:predicted protein [Mycena chlorophos]